MTCACSSTIANQGATAVANAERYATLQEAYLATVRSLAAAIDAKDAYTRGHSDRVAEYASLVADRIGLSGDEHLALELASYLHDIGKIGVSERVLHKPGRLDDAEFAEISAAPDDRRDHPRAGRVPVGDHADRAPPPRALGRLRLSRGARRRGDTAARAHPLGRRLARGDGLRPAVPQGHACKPTRWPSSSGAPERSSTRAS